MIELKKELWEVLFNSIDEGFCIIEMIFDEEKRPVDFRFLLINAAFERQSGLIKAEGKRMRELAPKHEEYWFELFGKIVMTGESVRMENQAKQLHRWFDVFAFRFGDEKNHQVAILFNDITERKLSDKTIKLLNKELSEKLQQLERANSELKAFSYSVSHDLRAPLRLVNNYISKLEKDLSGKTNEQIQKNIEAISRNSHKMEKLIEDLLAFSQISNNNISKNQVNSSQIVRNIIEEFCEQHSIDESIFQVGKLHSVSGDSAMLTQVWTNLISNAYKFSHSKSPQLIEIASELRGKEIIFSVKDNGVGFSMQYLNKLFGIFQRLHGNREFEGTGIGLAIVQRIVTRHGGKVWAEAKVDEGATFYFTMPA